MSVTSVGDCFALARERAIAERRVERACRGLSSATFLSVLTTSANRRVVHPGRIRIAQDRLAQSHRGMATIRVKSGHFSLEPRPDAVIVLSTVNYSQEMVLGHSW